MDKKKLSCIFLFVNFCMAFGQWQNLNLNQNVLSTFKAGDIEIAGTSTGIFYKNQNAATWTQASGITNKAISFDSYNNTIYASSYENLYKSVDNGMNWTPLNTVYTVADINAVAVADADNLIAGVKGWGIRFSVNGGTEWWGSDSSWQSKVTSIIKLKDGYFSSYSSVGQLQRSTSLGHQWYTPQGNGIKIGLSSTYQDINTLASLNDSTLIAGTKNISWTQGDGVYFSNDNGENFTKKINGLTTTAINSLATTGNLIFAGTSGGGVFYSNNEGNNWTSLNMGLTNMEVTRVYTNESFLYACTPTGIFRIDICSLLQGTSRIFSTANITAVNSKLLQANLGGKNYTWFKNGQIIPGANSSSYTATESGQYKVVINYSDTCADNSNMVNLTVQTLAAIESNYDHKNVRIYPNPGQNFIKIKTQKYHHVDYRIFDLTGKLILTGNTRTEDQINIQSLTAGNYIIRIKDGNQKEESIKFVKK
ncbi:T9SS type A sorting domain-containing protein [Chryseobacterium arthrosphaerae]|uniref:T9SS type A sorting domain-containing protein n=2 Tax=Chryseobacterium arthrosphaerae TaxID=651561 RepID=UPI0023E29B1F|nr:T9SS type A sorting domain-containing protein [Chryseobacterium arthrosphaerae]WES95778.1 T9SS type A sorting domain-containing protein [Chryseobacterium arthrosphaerae]